MNYVQFWVLVTLCSVYLVFQIIGTLFSLADKTWFHVTSATIVFMAIVLLMRPILDTFPFGILVLGAIMIAHTIKSLVLNRVSATPEPPRTAPYPILLQ